MLCAGLFFPAFVLNRLRRIVRRVAGRVRLLFVRRVNRQNAVHIDGDIAHTDRDRAAVIGDARDFSEHRFLNLDR